MTHVIVVVPPKATNMGCAGDCSMCHSPRSECQCFRRGGREVVNTYASLKPVEEFISTEPFFGREKHSDALALIQHERQQVLAAVASGNLDGRVLMKVDADCKRLVRMADGKLYATRSKMIERKQDSKGTPHSDRMASNEEVLQRYLARTSH